MHNFSPDVPFTTWGMMGGGARWVSIRDGVMTAREFKKLYRSPAACLGSSLLPLISPVCCIEYGSPIGVTPQTDRKLYSFITRGAQGSALKTAAGRWQVWADWQTETPSHITLENKNKCVLQSLFCKFNLWSISFRAMPSCGPCSRPDKVTLLFWKLSKRRLFI